MKCFILFLFVSLTTMARSLPVVQMEFGAKLTLKKATRLSKAISSYKSYQGKKILIHGEIVQVCKKKGCWMVVKAGEEDVRITFKDYGFFVPQAVLGKQARIEGHLFQKTLSIEDQKHYLLDEGKKQEAKKIMAPKKVYSFVATGVVVNRKG